MINNVDKGIEVGFDREPGDPNPPTGCQMFLMGDVKKIFVERSNIESIDRIRGNIRIDIKWARNVNAVSGRGYRDDRELRCWVDIWICYDRNPEIGIGEIKKFSFPRQYSPYFVADFGKRYYIGQHRRARLEMDKNGWGSDGIIFDIPMPPRAISKAEDAKGKGWPWVFIVVSEYEQNDEQAVNNLAQAVRINTSVAEWFKVRELNCT
ncbi:hypothetical protein V6M83_00025 [Streptococcus anginosus]|uniref:hypothetical protein n=1 Tax=Bacteria TaxID=2 RepID=UPI0024586A2E|nr:hypothetical protein [Pseudomonas aeruginosa]MDH4728391.1 hypothetical protein [Pseudomonas aeruginosa]